jgi:hypothetical protein
VKSLVMGLPMDLRFRTKGQLAIDILTGAYGDGLAFDFVCGDKVHGSCTDLRQFPEEQGQAHVLRVASDFVLALAPGIAVACAEAVKKLVSASGAGRSAPPAAGRRASAGTPGPGSRRRPRGVPC